MRATSIRLFLLRRVHYHWSTREIDPIKTLMKGLFDFLSPLDLCPRLSCFSPAISAFFGASDFQLL